jgi:preprotein translocase subunit YajC
LGSGDGRFAVTPSETPRYGLFQSLLGRERRLARKGLALETMMAATFFQAAGGGLSGILFLVLPMFAIMYFLVIMPQQRQRKKMQEMLSGLKTGDKVITNGGIYGTINGIDGDTFILKIATDPQVKIRISRSAITQVEASDDAK